MKQIFILVMLALTMNAMAQHHHVEQHEKGEHETNHGKHKVAFYSGFTHIPSAFYEHETHEESTGKWVPTIGIDYYYSLNHKWDVGIIADVELDEYYIHTDNHDDLERNNVVVLSAVGKYKPTKRIGLIAGPGMEWEFKKHDTETFFVLKTGIEYEVAIEKGWELTPVFTYDFKEEYSAYAFGISIGKRF
ncbi:hypothetical protein J1N10_03720 [Carboxylicivirga sp. A043]|uniref:hypothetical protein n=1 Tax=Carboxylicivirga litoralis TaxID=2816963 RepID=UPI0021CB39DF|nr:hypothetical protein [Carboxylicivirga sp. A043]MCU4155068.1 hypothetical protein [Carboxylicivirga sp. A043]